MLTGRRFTYKGLKNSIHIKYYNSIKYAAIKVELGGYCQIKLVNTQNIVEDTLLF